MNRINSFGRKGIGLFENRLQICWWYKSRWEIIEDVRIVNLRLGRLQIFLNY